MAVDNYNANINVNVNTGQSLAELRSLQAALSNFQQQINRGNRAATISADGLNQRLISQINSIQGLSAAQQKIVGTTENFTRALERNKLTLREYARYSAAGFLEGGVTKALSERIPALKNVLSEERKILQRAYQDRVKLLQSQWIALKQPGVPGGNLGIRVTPTELKGFDKATGMTKDFTTNTQLAAQRMQILNATLKQGATQLINWGKNTQWAGRQLMVGLTMPLIMLGSVSMRTFKEMEMATLRFRRVYGDLFTTDEETNQAVESIRRLAQEYTKFGVAVSDTMEMAAQAAAMGKVGADLQAQVEQATKLAVLGGVEQQQALETTISLTNAFGIASQDLARNIDFLNAVENQTVVSIEDLTIAIPKAGPVVKQLGGDVKDLAFFLTAMREGGINASEGANALKSGLASLINPTDKASKMLAGFGINIKGIVEANKGDLKGTVVSFAKALDSLGNDNTGMLRRAQAIEQLFGKFQFARLSALFTNITKEGSQAAKVFDLMGSSVEELAILSERELGKVEESVAVKFQKTLEELKVTLMPLGKLFMESLMPILKFAGNLIERFNELGDGTKKAILAFTVGFPAILMTLGLFGNLIGNTVKGLTMLFFGLAKARSQSNILGASFNYTTQETIENTSMTYAMVGAHQAATNAFNVEIGVARQLAVAYNEAAAAAARLAAASPKMFIGGKAGAAKATSKLPKKFNRGTTNVQYYAKGTDTVPAMLTPGEAVIPADQAQDPKNKPFIQAMLQGKEVQQFDTGSGGVTQSGGLTPAQKRRNIAAQSYIIRNAEEEAAFQKRSQASKRGWETRKLNALKAETAALEESAKAKKTDLKEEKRAKVGRVAGGASLALTGLSMGAYATGNNTAGTALMGAAVAANFAPLLMNPWVAAGAAVAALGASFIILNKIIEGRAKKEEQFVRSIVANTDQMRRVSEATRTVGASQIMAERRAGGSANLYNETKRAGREFGGQFLSSDIGKEIYKAFRTNKDIYGTKQAAEQFATQLAAYISDGIMTAEQANSIAEQIAVNLGDVTIRTKIQGELLMLVGPNGEDLIRDPLQVRLDLIQKSGRQARRLRKDEGFMSLQEEADATKPFWMSGGKARIRMGAAQMAGFDASSMELAQAQVDAITVYYDKLIDTKKVEKARTSNLQEQERIQGEINRLIQRQSEGQQRLQQEVNKTYTQALKNFDKNIQQEGGFFDIAVLDLFKGRAEAEDAYFDALKGKIKDIYKGTEFETATNTLLSRLAKLSDTNLFKQDEFRAAGFDTAREAQQFEVSMQLLLANKQANADQITAFMALFDGKLKEGKAALDLSIKTQGAAKTFELQSILSQMGTGKKAKAIAQEYFVKISALPSKEFDKQLNALSVLSELDGAEINMKLLLSDDSFDLKDYSNDLAKLEAMPDVTDKTVKLTLEKIGMDENGIQGLMKDWETYYSKLPEDVRKEAIQKYATFYTFQTEFKDDAAKRIWIEEYAKKRTEEILAANKGKVPMTYDTVYRFQVENLTGMSDEELRGIRAGEQTKTYIGPLDNLNTIIPPNGNDVEKTRASKDSALDDLLKKLKFVRDAAIDAEGGVKELLRITSGKGVKKFEGVTQQLLGGLGKGGKGGFNREFISFLEGLDNKTRKTFMTIKNGQVILTKQGKALKEAFNEKVIGEFQVSQVKTIQDTKAQQAALLRLQASGVSTATALEMVADANLAVAINSKNITNKELKQMAKDAEEAKKKVRELNLEFQNGVSDIEKTGKELEETIAVLDKIQEIKPNVSKEFLQSLAGNKAAIQAFYDAFFKGATNNIPKLKKYIDQTFKNMDLEIEIKGKINKQDIVNQLQEAFDQASSVMEKYLSGMRAQKTLEILPPTKRNTLEKNIASARYAVTVAQRNLAQVKDSTGKTINDYEKTISSLQNKMAAGIDAQIRDLSASIEARRTGINTKYDNLIKPLQATIDKIQEGIRKTFDEPIEKLQRDIAKIERNMELQFDRPIAALQEESSDLANDLALMDQVVDGINKKYDEQEKALSKISDINQDIINQQKGQISLADALSRGDIAAAAQAAQDMREQAAEAASRRAQGTLDAARESEISAVRSASGMTRDQIEKRQFEISQQIYQLEEQREVQQARILVIQDQIYALDIARQVELDKIVDLEKQIADYEKARNIELDALIKDEEKLAELERQRASAMKDIWAAEDAIAKIKESQEYKDAEKALEEAEKAQEAAEQALADAEEELRRALEEVDKQQATWDELILTITAEATPAVKSFADMLKEAKDKAKDLAAAMKEVVLADQSLTGDEVFGTKAKTGTGYMRSDDPALDTDPASRMANAQNKFAASQAGKTGNATGTTGTGNSTSKNIADNLKSASTSAPIVRDAMSKIAEYSKLTREDQEIIAEAIKSQSIDIKTVVEQHAFLTPLLEAQIEPLTIMTQLFKDQVLPVTTIREEIEKFILRVEWFLSPKNLYGMVVFVSDWALIRELLEKYINPALKVMLDELLKQILDTLDDILKVAKDVTKEIESWNTTVTTRHVIEVEYKYLNKGPGVGSVPGSMYGGKIKNFNFGGKVSYFNNGDMVAYKPVGSDTVPAMLTPGEFVTNKAATQQFLPLLKTINESKYPQILSRKLNNPKSPKSFGQNVRSLAQGGAKGGIGKVVSNLAQNINSTNFAPKTIVQPNYNVNRSEIVAPRVNNTNTSLMSDNSNSVYNYNVSVNVGGSSSSADTIAREVMNQIRYYNDQQIRSI